MRWESLRADPAVVDRAAAGQLPLALPEPPAPDRGTGRAGLHLPAATPIEAGTDDQFAIEVRARSIINRVPGSSRMSFQWTVNPYRGCGHACVYCLAGDTPMLMADGTTRPLVELQIGDEIYGTVRQGEHRRYTVTRVLAHWSTLKSAYRVRLADGTELTASGDHRFLTEEGWRYVTARPTGEEGQPAAGARTGLAGGARLMGIGDAGTPCREPLIGTTVTTSPKLEIVAVEPVGMGLPLYDITTGTGDFIANGVVSHNCFARKSHTYLDLDAGHDFDSKIVVKVNAGQLLRAELASGRWRGDPIAMGTNVDCYQRAEGRYRLMREILAALRDHANPYSILTKGTLIQRDLDLLTESARVTRVGVAFSVGLVDDELWRSVEPGTPRPAKRLDVIRRFTDAGIGCSVLMAPILPGLTDTAEQIERTVAAIAASGARSVTPLVLHLRPGAREWYLSWLAREHPRLLPRYRQLYRDGSYAPAAYQRQVTARVRTTLRRYRLAGGTDPAADFRQAGTGGVVETDRQPTLL